MNGRKPGGRRGGHVVSALGASPRSERSGFESWPGTPVLFSLARHLTLTVPLSTQGCKWVPAVGEA